MRFTVGIFGRDQFQHVACFEEVAQTLSACLRDLGHETTDFGSNQGRLVMFGVNNVTDEARRIPPDAIVFNTEQVASVDGLKHMENWRQFQNHVVWDYSRANVTFLRERGFKRVVYCPIGYHERMERFTSVAEPDIDVLHYGSLNDRRYRILEAIKAKGLRVGHLFGVYGAERDAVIARAKVVVNLHFYEHPIFEIFRVSHLLANRVPVITEDGGCDLDLEDFAARTCIRVPVESIPEVCVTMCGDEMLRARSGIVGYNEFRKVKFMDHVERAISES